MVECDKIGAGSFFWSLPSKGYQTREVELKSMDKRIDETQTQIEEAKVRMKKEMEIRDDPENKRDEKLDEIERLKAECQKY